MDSDELRDWCELPEGSGLRDLYRATMAPYTEEELRAMRARILRQVDEPRDDGCC